MAGAGKTTIAYTVCDYLESSGHPTASFFCTRHISACRKASLILPEVSYQLALVSHPFLCALHEGVNRNVVVQEWSIQDQFERLIATPLRKVRHTFSADPVVVIDALNECEDSGAVDDLLKALLADKIKILPIRFIITSRCGIETIHCAQKERIDQVVTEQNLDRIHSTTVTEDIRTYLASEIPGIGLPLLELDGMTELSGALFRHAAFFVRYVLGNDMTRIRERTSRLLGFFSEQDNDIWEDTTYEAILDAILDEDFHKEEELSEIKLVLHTVMCARVPFTVGALASFLAELPDFGLAIPLESALQALHPVLQISWMDGLLTPRYKSLRGYMLDQGRSGKYYCNATQDTLHCFNIIQSSSPSYNICDLPSSYLRDSAVPGVDGKVNSTISHHLLRACRRWGAYIERSQPSEELFGALYEFLSSRLLLWMEVLNLKQCMHDGLEQLRKASAWLEVVGGPDSIRTLLEDAEHFVEAFLSSPLSEHTPHIYVSMLALWPADRPVSQHYMQQIPGSAKMKWTQRNGKRQGVYWLGSAVQCVAYSPSGGYIAVGVCDVIQFLDTCTQQIISESFKGHADSVLSIAYSPDGAHIVSGSSDNTIGIWDIHTGQLIGQPRQGHADSVLSIAYSPDGAHIVSGSSDNTIRVWDAQTGQPIDQPLQGHTHSVRSVAYSPDGAHIVSGSSDHTIRIWDTHTGRSTGRPLEGHTGWVNTVIYSPDGARIASGSDDKTIRIWCTYTGPYTGRPTGQPLRGHADSVRSVAYSPDSVQIVSSSDDKTIRIWDAHTGQQIGRPFHGHTDWVRSVAYSPDGAYIVSGSLDKTTRIWDRYNGQLIGQPLQGHTHSVWSVAYSPDGTRIVSGSRDHTICIWDARTGQLIGEPLQGHTSTVVSVAYSPDGAHIVSGSSAKPIRIWDANTGRPIGRPLRGHTDSVWSVAYSPDGARIVSGSDDNTIRIWDAHTGHSINQPLQGHTDSVWSVTYSPDGAHIVSASSDKTIRVWDAHTGRPIGQPLYGHTDWVNSAAYSPDGARIVSGSRDHTIRVWDACTGQPIGQPLRGHTHSVRSVAYSPDGAHIVSGSLDKTIRIWDAGTGQSIGQPLQGHTDSIWSVAYSPDGACIVSGSHDNTIRTWDAGIQSPIGSRLHYPESPPSSVSSPQTPSTQEDVGSANPQDTILAKYWQLNADGWVVDSNGHQLVWVPYKIRAHLARPPTQLIISPIGGASLDFSDVRLGEDWARCFDEKSSSPVEPS
ncbi:hypothetical protein FRC12_006935 [Ceratobasidium sp. 428]|nr:hypothetical protein FRC12_006935 [Ceratobasidium sp. 428]